MNIIYFEKNETSYVGENGNVYVCNKNKVIPLVELYEAREFELIKKAFISCGQYFHAYVLDEIESHIQEYDDYDFELEYLHDTIVKLWLSNKLTMTIDQLIMTYINEPVKYKEIYNDNIGRFLSYIIDAA
jgi:hypothetical protein